MTYSGTIIQGDDIEITVTVRDANGTVVNLTGITAATFKLKKTISGDLILSKTLGSGVSVVSAVAGTLKVVLSTTDTAALDPVRYFFEIEITDASSKKSTVRDEDFTLGELTVLEDL